MKWHISTGGIRQLPCRRDYFGHIWPGIVSRHIAADMPQHSPRRVRAVLSL